MNNPLSPIDSIDSHLQSKRPSRTYIQMEIKLHELGKLPMMLDYYNLLQAYQKKLDAMTEQEIEKIVKSRVACIHFLDQLYPDLHIGAIHMCMLEMNEIDNTWDHYMEKNFGGTNVC